MSPTPKDQLPHVAVPLISYQTNAPQSIGPNSNAPKTPRATLVRSFFSYIGAAFRSAWSSLRWLSRLEVVIWRTLSASFVAKALRRIREAWIFSSWIGRALVMVIVLWAVTWRCYHLRIEVHQPYTGIRSVGGQPARGGGVYLCGGMQKWDPDTKTLQVHWVPQWCTGTSDCPPWLNNHILLFTDINALGIGGFNPSAAAMDIQANSTTNYHHDWDQTFDLVITERPRRFEASNVNGLDTNALYPFESYALSTLIAAVDADNLTYTYDVLGADIVNWVQSDWVAIYDYDYIDDIPGRARILNFLVTMRRHPIVKVTAIIIASINWALTIALAYMTLAYTMGGRELPAGSDSVALMFTALFALPSVRSTMPGNPPFGCLLDAVGIIPNLLIVAVCATWLLLHKLFVETRPRDSSLHLTAIV